MQLKNISSSTNRKQFFQLSQFFPTSFEPSFKTIAVKEFSIRDKGNLLNIVTEENYPLIAIEEIPKQYYIVIAKDRSWEWGAKSNNYFFGLRQAIDVNLIYNPTAYQNILLCENSFATLVLLHLGIPAIQVDPITVWDNIYFNSIIRKLFSNIIVTYPKRKIPSKIFKDIAIKHFDIEDYVKRDGVYTNLISYAWNRKESESFFEPLWNMYTYINSDIELNIDHNLISIVNN